MKLEPNNKSLSFADFLEAAFRDKADTKPFPYTLEVCRCRYCSYCQSGKCALKRCCCMSERVKAKSCTFAELLRDCFANFKDNVFQYRLRIACERASELQSCFLDAGHKGRFYEGVTLLRKKDPKFIAQIYLLSASELLWIRAKQVMCSPGFIDYLLLPAIVVALYLVGGFSMWTVKGIVLALILLYASLEDLSEHQADDFLWVMLVILSLVNYGDVGIGSMIFGAIAVFVPQMAIAMFTKKGGIGGADIKLSTAAALSLGFYGGVIGYMIGLVFAIVFQTIYNKAKKQSNKEAFPLLPFLSTGLMIGYFI